ncbi:hypothetical protein CC85DRAFT_331699 [Cutaneotrichosporon oleaginosum]|uniref:VPS9 domain-containing protein n=1 Tax=Cutaneotrichosporon oleaginosum TaxID=879819 RepID=A0A0J0XB46_9TREE|nr:uncharacterized protein CC85DRAFT_331699 [Cutaneotrichosporon oleaginosum]KLT38332.1 hypothetical protein CC85DRAFT_331699 [Cutaneotrichosporon oleaginosum]TXT14143.1 hypothetical protein COLE_00336 [Cutaneotrichosporon oleaginosum]
MADSGPSTPAAAAQPSAHSPPRPVSPLAPEATSTTSPEPSTSSALAAKGDPASADPTLTTSSPLQQSPKTPDPEISPAHSPVETAIVARTPTPPTSAPASSSHPSPTSTDTPARPTDADTPTPRADLPTPTPPAETPAPQRTATPPAPAKPPAPAVLAPTPGETPGPSDTPAPSAPAPPALRVRADLAEFDPYDTPAPARPARPGEGRDENSGRREAGEGRDGRGGQPESERSDHRRERERREDARQEDAPRRRSTPRPEEPAFNFAGFLKDLRAKSADPVARYLKSFLTNFAKKPFTVNEQIKLIHDFLAFIEGKMRAVEPWKSQSEAEFDNALEAMEKLVMNRLYPYTFTPQLHDGHPITTDDLERDAVFAQRVRLFGWVQEKHLDVPEGEAAQGFLGFAEQELLKINHYKAPRDKMICILNCCKVIFGLIRHAMGNEAGADAFVPILIFVVLRASPDCMLSNVEYIQRFRNPEKLQGEAGYYLSSLQGAIAFIETMDASSLSNITQEEFENKVERAIQELPESPSSPRARAALPTNDMSPFATSPGEEQAQQLALPASAAALDGTKRFFQRTGDAAKEAVSRPLSAISKILENMQQQGYDSESGDEDGEREADRGALATPSCPPQPQPPSRLLAQLGISPAPSEGVSREPTPQPFPQPVFQQYPGQQYPGQQYAGQQYPGQQQQYLGQQQIQQGQHPGQQQQQHPSQQQQYAGQQGQYPHPPPPGYGEPYRDNMQNTLEASHAEYAREQARAANVLTLHQMFPDLDEEIVEAVLYSCGEDLGVTIDR